MPVVIHAREAMEAIKSILQGRNLRGVMHCFAGDRVDAEWFLERGFYLGVNGIVTFPNAKGLQAVIADVPLDRLLLETDCPYLAPQPVRGKTNSPAYVRFVADMVAELQNKTVEDVASETSANAENLFGF